MKTALERGYNYKWQQAGKRFLLDNPLCVYCQKVGRITPATVVDHIIPHRGDEELFWDVSNWQSLCKRCHDSVKAKEERGKHTGCDAEGKPLSPLHPWNKGEGEGPR
jgi:5-methylcytosine-specific restriction protein A